MVAVEKGQRLMSDKHRCRIGEVSFGDGRLAVIAGPCMAESLQLCQDVAGSMAELCAALDIGYVFKASYDKANRTSVESYRGPGLDTGLDWLATVARDSGAPVLSDVHDVTQVTQAAKVLNCLQIPAFLCRQTDLLVAAGQTGRCVNIKKGQFMAPWDMGQAVEKVRSTGNNGVLLTERGTSFGYNRLVTDFRAIPEMQTFAPVVFDATHSVQEPGGLGNASGGRQEFIATLARAAMAAGADALFLEVHPDPDHAKSDAASQLPLSVAGELLEKCMAVYKIVRAGR